LIDIENSSSIGKKCKFNEQLVFDRDLFKKEESDQAQRFVDLIELIQQEEPSRITGNLDLKEYKFRGFEKYHSLLGRTVFKKSSKCFPIYSEIQQLKNVEKEPCISLKKAQFLLLENQYYWYKRWKLKTNLDFQSCIKENMNTSHKIIRDSITTYLFFVEMICTIVLISYDGSDVDSELKKAFDVYKKLTTDWIPALSITIRKHKEVLLPRLKGGGGILNSMSFVWNLLEIWLETHHQDFLNTFLKAFIDFHRIKTFFNLIFHTSIKQLSYQIKK
jgi:hypothetical protein